MFFLRYLRLFLIYFTHLCCRTVVIRLYIYHRKLCHGYGHVREHSQSRCHSLRKSCNGCRHLRRRKEMGKCVQPKHTITGEQPTVEKTSRTTGLGTTMAMAGKLRIHQCLGCIACLLAHITNYKTSITVIKPTIPLLHLLHMTVCVCKR